MTVELKIHAQCLKMVTLEDDARSRDNIHGWIGQ